MMSSPRHCGNCGQELRPGVRFCPECGRALAMPVPQDTPRSTEFSSAPGPSEMAPVPVSPGYLPTTSWPAMSAADPVPVPVPVPAADPGAPFTSAPSDGREPGNRLAADLPGGVPPKRSRWLLLGVFIAAVVVGVGTAIVFVAFPSHHPPASNADTARGAVTARPSSPAPATPSAGVTSSAAASPASTSREQAAQALSTLLAQSGTDRTAVTQAANAVEDCSAGLSQDEAIFAKAASARQALLGQLAALPGRSTLPAPMLQDLTLAWQVSGQADQDFAKWTQDEITQGCSTNDQSDANFLAATAPDDKATKYKKAFAALWTSIATQYSLPVYQYNQV